MRWMLPGLCLLVALGCAPKPKGMDSPTVSPDHWGRNLVANAGFELDADKNAKPDGWGFQTGCAWDSAVKHSGARSLRFTNTNPNTYRLITAPLKLMPGVRYRISAWVKAKGVANAKAHNQGAGLCIEWMDANGKHLGGSYPSCKIGTYDWRQLEGISGPVPDKAAKAHVVVYLRKHATGTAWFDDVRVEAYRGPLLSARLLQPTYRATATPPTTGKPVEVELHINRREYALPGGRLAVSASVVDAAGMRMATLPRRRVATGAESARLAWTLPKLPVGWYTVPLALLGHDDKPLGKISVSLRVARPVARKVTVDARKRLLIDGKPFFPLGLYLGPTQDEHLARIAAGGFNTILCYGYGTAKEPLAYLDRAKRHGLKVVYSIKDIYEGTRWYRNREGMTDLEHMQYYIELCRAHPAVIAWYTNDELSPKWMPKLQAAYDQVCAIDPNHPTFQVLCRPGDFKFYYGVTDILGCDPYPIPSRPVTMVGDWMETAHAAVSHAKPVWCVPQIFQWGVYRHDPEVREPTFAEKRAMIFLALIHRANGLICYSYYDLFKAIEKGKKAPDAVFQRRWREVSSIGLEVKRLIPALLEGTEVGVSHTDPIRYRALALNGVTHILAVNTSPDAEADLAIPVRRAKTAKRVDTNKTATFARGKLTDRLKPLETAIYEVR